MSRAWAAGAPLVAATPAGIEWWYASSWPDPLEAHLRLWRDETTGDDVAWTWQDGDELEWHVWTGRPELDAAVTQTILETVIGGAGGHPVRTWSAEDDARTLATLADLGFEASEQRLSQWQRQNIDPPPPEVPTLPRGFAVRSLRGAEDIPARVEVHRAAFAPSRLTVEKYERLSSLPHYTFADDLVVEAPDGSFAAFAMAWWDPEGRVGEFEPVGTHPAYQRRGLGRALLRYGLQRYVHLGARVVQVYSDAASAPAEALYASVGFRRGAVHRRYERSGESADRATGQARG